MSGPGAGDGNRPDGRAAELPRNPYARPAAAAAATPPPPQPLPLPLPQPQPQPQPPMQGRLLPPQSLPQHLRLPSRAVTFRSAEILTVSELSGLILEGGNSIAGCSVRVTGVLLRTFGTQPASSTRARASAQASKTESESESAPVVVAVLGDPVEGARPEPGPNPNIHSTPGGGYGTGLRLRPCRRLSAAAGAAARSLRPPPAAGGKKRRLLYGGSGLAPPSAPAVKPTAMAIATDMVMAGGPPAPAAEAADSVRRQLEGGIAAIAADVTSVLPLDGCQVGDLLTVIGEVRREDGEREGTKAVKEKGSGPAPPPPLLLAARIATNANGVDLRLAYEAVLLRREHIRRHLLPGDDLWGFPGVGPERFLPLPPHAAAAAGDDEAKNAAAEVCGGGGRARLGGRASHIVPKK